MPGPRLCPAPQAWQTGSRHAPPGAAESMRHPAPIRPAVDALKVSGIQQVFDRGIGRSDVIGLWVGESDLPTPRFICEAAEKALRDGQDRKSVV